MILAHKVILALAETPCLSSSRDRQVTKVQQRQSNAALQQQLDMIRLVALNTERRLKEYRVPFRVVEG